MNHREKMKQLYPNYQPCNSISPSGRLCMKPHGHGGSHICQGVPTRGTIVWDNIDDELRKD